MEALILVDLQNDFCPGGALSVKEGDAIIPLINALQEHFALIVATQDFHPLNHKSFASHHPGKKPGDVIELDGLSQILWPDHCVAGTRGAELVRQLKKNKINHVVEKGTDPNIDSYSAFFDNGHKKETGLKEYLQSKKVNHVFIVGLATDYCVKYTAMDAIGVGFSVTVVIDACRGVDLHPGDVEDAIREMKRLGVRVLLSDSVIRAGKE